MSYFIEIYEKYQEGDHFLYDLYWRIPYYAPAGNYRIGFFVKGITKEQLDTGFNITRADNDPTYYEMLETVQKLIEEERENMDLEVASKKDLCADQEYEKVPLELKNKFTQSEITFGCGYLNFTMTK